MNRKQRESNRCNARKLAQIARARILVQHVCENCGENGGHWVSTRGMSIAAIITGQDDSEGFWVCPKLYDENGRRKGSTDQPDENEVLATVPFGSAIHNTFAE